MTSSEEHDLERIADLVVGLERLARDLPNALTDLKSDEAASLARDLPTLSEALRLAISLDIPPSQLVPDAVRLEQCFHRLQRLAAGSRLTATNRGALELGRSLATRLASELRR